MDRIIAANTVAIGTGDTYPTTGAPGDCTSGNPNATPPVPPTINPAYAMNMLVNEIRNVIVATGLTPNGADWTQLKQALFLFGSPQLFGFASPGSGIFAPPADWTRCGVLIIGGGGAGGNGNGGAGGGGQAGAAILDFFSFAAGSTIDYLVGEGADAGGAAGGTSSVGGRTAVGGAGGSNGAAGSAFSNGGSSGGEATGGTINLPGAVGGQGVAVETLWQSGPGGASLLGAGGICSYGDGSYSNTGISGQGPGAGGSGGILDGVGGPGVGGIILFFGTAASE